MSSLEVFVGISALVLTLIFAVRWYSDLLRVNPLRPLRRERLILAVLPPLCMIAILLALLRAASSDVCNDPFWLLYYTFLGLAWVRLSLSAASLLGLDARTDILERGNRAALYLLTSATIGFTICFIGGDIGEGPGAEAVLASAGLATLTVFALWTAMEWLGKAPHERITVDRDVDSAVRVSGFLLGIAPILGYAASGDWNESALASDFVRAAWPALPLTAVAILVERRLPSRIASLTFAIFFPAAGILIVMAERRA